MNTKLFPTIIFAISVVLLIVGLHQTMLNGFAESYWVFSFATGFFLWFAYLKRNEKMGEEVAQKYEKMTGKKIVNPTKKAAKK
ncbi:MAG: hypothetical protein ACKVOU_05265 [Cytophagales bacterium]